MPKPKNTERIRICVDMRLPDQDICRERHISLTVDDIIHNLNGAVMFSKLDLNSGYHQPELAPEFLFNPCWTEKIHKAYIRYLIGS